MWANSPWAEAYHAASVDSAIAELREAALSGKTSRAQTILGTLEEKTIQTESQAGRLERLLSPWVTYVVLPTFALANAGVEISWQRLQTMATEPIAQGTLAGLLLGKFAGISGASWATVKLKLGKLPTNVAWPHIVGVSFRGGIGCTVSLFFVQLAFRSQSEAHTARVAVLMASSLAAVLGAVWLWWTASRDR